MNASDLPARTGLEIAQQLEDEGLVYTESDYDAFCAMRAQSSKAELIAYFGSLKFEQMGRRWYDSHCETCGIDLLEEEMALTDRWREPRCGDCNDAIPPDDKPAHPSAGLAAWMRRYT